MSDIFGGGGGQTVNTVQNADPWKGVQPYLADAFSKASALGQRGYSAPFAPQGGMSSPSFSGGLSGMFTAGGQPQVGQSGPFDFNQVLASQSPYTLQAQQMAAQRATDPNSLIGQSQSMLGNTISGQYLNPSTNPFLKSSVEDALGLAGSAYAKQYGGAAGQNLGNSGYQEALARGLGSAATNAYSNAYSQERQNQLNATQLAPQFSNADIQQLAGVGSAEEARRQQEIDSPWASLQKYIQSISGQPGGTTQGQTPYYTNPLANALGLGIGGTALYNGLGAAGLFGGAAGGAGGAALGTAGAGDIFSTLGPLALA